MTISTRTVIVGDVTCAVCRQAVPVRRDHTMVTHWVTSRKRGEPTCVASNTTAHCGSPVTQEAA